MTPTEIQNKPQRESPVEATSFLFSMNNIPFLETYFETLTPEAKASFDKNKEVLLDTQLLLEDGKGVSQDFLEIKKSEPERAEELELSLAVLMREHNINPVDYPQYELLNPEDRLDFILSVARRDEFLQTVTGAMAYADLFRKMKDLPDDNPTKVKAREAIKKYGFEDVEEYQEIYTTEPTRKNILLVRNHAPELIKKHKVDKARLALVATAHFNNLFPENSENNEKRIDALNKLGFPTNLPSDVQSPRNQITDEMSRVIASVVSQKLSFQQAL